VLKVVFPRLDLPKPLILLLQEIIARSPNSYTGTGSPEGAVTGDVGDLYTNRSGGAGTTLYVKESGNGTNTGWVAK
jgi:hypothetical protein